MIKKLYNITIKKSERFLKKEVCKRDWYKYKIIDLSVMPFYLTVLNIAIISDYKGQTLFYST